VAIKPYPAWFSRFALKEARLGHPGPLIAHLQTALQGYSQLSHDELLFIIEALDATEGQRGRNRLRDIEVARIVHAVDDAGRPLPRRQAIDDAMKRSGWSRRKIYSLIPPDKKRRPRR
jgi:hypothetical protein